MDDMISRQAAIEAIFKLYEYMRMINPTEATDSVRQGVFLAGLKIEQLPCVQPEQCEYAVNALAVEEMLKDLLPKRGIWEIEWDEAKTAICETVHDALEGLWKLPFVKPDSKELSLTQKALDNDMPSACSEVLP